MSPGPLPPSSPASPAGRPAGGGVSAPVTVASLTPGQLVDAVFACTRKERLTARSGSPYLALELRDRTGAIAGRVFREADVMAGRFARGDLVRVRGRVERFRDELQLEVMAIIKAPPQSGDPADFLPVAYRDLEELEGFFEHLAREVADPGLARLLATLWRQEALRRELRRAPCTRGGHHAYLGGLLEHTVAVATMALELAPLHPRLDRDLLLCAALVHDLGKTREFAYGAEITVTDEGRLLGHVELTLRILAEHLPPDLDPGRRISLEHCVLLHHGPDAAGGRRFGSVEALALYRLNLLDAQVKGALEHGLDSR